MTNIFVTIFYYFLSLPVSMFTLPLARTVLGHNGFLGSHRGISSSWGFSTCPIHGLFIRCGETRIQSPRRGLYLVCWYSVGSKDLPIFSSVEGFPRLVLLSAIFVCEVTSRSCVSIKTATASFWWYLQECDYHAIKTWCSAKSSFIQEVFFI